MRREDKITRLTGCSALLLMWLAATVQGAALMPIKWTADGSEAKPYVASIAQGETRQLEVTLKNYGQPVTIPTTATAELWYQTNGMGRAYWSGGVATVTTGGVVTATWTPLLDCGATMYNFALGVVQGTDKLYTAYGQIRMRTAPGWVANELPQPWPSLDFATIEVFNPPWTTLETITNIVSTIAAGSTGGIGEEEDPIALPIATSALAVAQAKLPATNNLSTGRWTVPALSLSYIDSSGFNLGNTSLPGNSLNLSTMSFMTLDGSTINYKSIEISGLGGTSAAGATWTGLWTWPDTTTESPLIKRDELMTAIAGATDTNAVSRTGDTMTGLLTGSADGIAWQCDGLATNFIIKVEYDGTNVNFNVYEVSR